MLMRRMPRLKIAIVVLFALVLTFEPVVHHHSLAASGKAPTLCAVCAAGADRITIAVVTVVAPAVVLFTLLAPRHVVVAIDARLPLSSRAPPAA